MNISAFKGISGEWRLYLGIDSRELRYSGTLITRILS